MFGILFTGLHPHSDAPASQLKIQAVFSVASFCIFRPSALTLLHSDISTDYYSLTTLILGLYSDFTSTIMICPGPVP